MSRSPRSSFYLASTGATIADPDALADSLLLAVIVDDALWLQSMAAWRARRPNFLRRKAVGQWREQHRALMVERHRIERLARLCAQP
jgi:hypothetical protein